MKRILGMTVTLVVALLITSQAQARTHHKRHHHVTKITYAVVGCEYGNDGKTVCRSAEVPIAKRKIEMRRVTVADANGNVSESIIGGRPAGCPHAYCGCGARLHLGISDPRLNLAWNWTKYYHGSTLVAVWPHHVAIIERMTGPHTAILIDYNSGLGLSRHHERSIAGARIVGGVGQMAALR